MWGTVPAQDTASGILEVGLLGSQIPPKGCGWFLVAATLAENARRVPDSPRDFRPSASASFLTSSGSSRKLSGAFAQQRISQQAQQLDSRPPNSLLDPHLSLPFWSDKSWQCLMSGLPIQTYSRAIELWKGPRIVISSANRLSCSDRVVVQCSVPDSCKLLINFQRAIRHPND